MMHAGHAPMAVAFLAHGHASAAQPTLCHIDGEFILVPHGFADRMKCAFSNPQMRLGSYMKVALAKISGDFFAAIQLLPVAG